MIARGWGGESDEQVEDRGFFRAENILCVILERWIHVIIHLSNPQAVQHEVWTWCPVGDTMCQRRLILPSGRTIPGSYATTGEILRERRKGLMWYISISSSQLPCSKLYCCLIMKKQWCAQRLGVRILESHRVGLHPRLLTRSNMNLDNVTATSTKQE